MTGDEDSGKMAPCLKLSSSRGKDKEERGKALYDPYTDRFRRDFLVPQGCLASA